MTEKPIMQGLWRDDPKTPEGKYLVKRRDGTVPEWPSFTLGARDPCAPTALRAYAVCAGGSGMTLGYVNALFRLADEWDIYRQKHGTEDPDRGQHRPDDPTTVAEMKKGRSA